MQERQGGGVDVIRGLCPPGCRDGAAGVGMANGLHSYFLHLGESPEVKGGCSHVREAGCRARQVLGVCKRIPHKAGASHQD